MTPNISIDGRQIGRDHPPYVIAELSANHNGSLPQALKVIDSAFASGADAIKIQTYTPDTMTLDCGTKDFQVQDGLWAGRTLYDLYQEAHTPWSWHKTLFEHARKLGITIFSTPFDVTAADLLEELGAPAYKIASFEAIDPALIRYVAGKGKPMIISTGMASVDEIGEAVRAARDGGCKEVMLLHCVSGYPAPADDYNLVTMLDMEQRFGVPVGLSDHTLNNVSAITSIALGATAIEKHFTLDRNGGGPDDSFSLEPSDLKQLCRDARIAWEALGKVDYGLKSSEKSNTVFRRSLYVTQDIASGQEITASNIRSVRPGYGLEPKHYDAVLGRIARRDLVAGEPLLWSCLESK